MNEALFISRKASRDEISRQYHALAKKLHPDCGGSDEEMARLNAAYKEGMGANVD